MRAVVSCPGGIAVMGMNVSGSGSEDGGKRVKWRDNAGICSSKGPGIGGNHGRGYQPKDVGVWQPESGKRVCGYL